MSEEDSTVVWVGNIDDRVSEDLLYELFLQAGPVEYVKQPKDKASGKKKNFAFVGYKHECSVAYAIALMNSIKLCGRSLRVQSRYIQSLQAQGLASGDPRGVHTLDQFQKDNSSEEQGMSQTREACSLLGPPPPPLNVPANIPPHILALAHQQMALLNNRGMVPLSQNPSLNARMQPRNDNYGSINYNRGYSNSGQDSSSSHGYNHYNKNRNRGSRSFDNKTMQAMKMHADEVTAQNSHMLAALQDQQGRFDKSRLGSSPCKYNEDRYDRDYDTSHDNRYRQNQEGHYKPSHRDYRQQPYDRYESHHSRHQDRQNPSDSRRKFDDKSRNGGRSHSYNSDRYGRGGEYQPHYNSRR
ncbi:RNA-binding protein 7-like isoform X1 [Macrobrachium rosenbergii]|uniref:RNA-binding protein 7-like isoform X1 n=1 Tax=Macrobrachium rosenbergii TaxID=79674 RepID=UPI0034D6E733